MRWLVARSVMVGVGTWFLVGMIVFILTGMSFRHFVFDAISVDTSIGRSAAVAATYALGAGAAVIVAFLVQREVDLTPARRRDVIAGVAAVVPALALGWFMSGEPASSTALLMAIPALGVLAFGAVVIAGRRPPQGAGLRIVTASILAIGMSLAVAEPIRASMQASSDEWTRHSEFAQARFAAEGRQQDARMRAKLEREHELLVLERSFMDHLTRERKVELNRNSARCDLVDDDTRIDCSVKEHDNLPGMPRTFTGSRDRTNGVWELD